MCFPCVLLAFILVLEIVRTSIALHGHVRICVCQQLLFALPTCQRAEGEAFGALEKDHPSP